MKPTKVIICGVNGRMGQTLVASARQDPELELIGGVDVGDDLSAMIDQCDVIIEFALAEATLQTAMLAADHRKAMVIGTTGHSAGDKLKITSLIKDLPVVWAANFSTGVNALFWATRKVAAIVGNEWQAEITETHHITKKDAPSGTAKRLQEILAEVRGTEPAAHALRIGDVVGDHTVTFGSVGERIELTHRASSRETFARGALRAAKWVVGQKPGLYDMQAVLGLE